MNKGPIFKIEKNLAKQTSFIVEKRTLYFWQAAKGMDFTATSKFLLRCLKNPTVPYAPLLKLLRLLKYPYY